MTSGNDSRGRSRRIWSVLFALAASLAVSANAHAQSDDDYKARCTSVAGREQLIAQIDPITKTDLGFQARGLGVDSAGHLRGYIAQRCLMITGVAVDPADALPQSWPIELIMSPAYDGVGVCKGCGLRTGTINAPSGQNVCFVRSYRTAYVSTAEPTTLPAVAEITLVPAGIQADGGATGYDVSVRAASHASVEIKEIVFASIQATAPGPRRRALGCVDASSGTITIGRRECTEDRSGPRYGDRCDFSFAAAGSRVELTRSNLHKAIVSKAAGDMGEDSVTFKHFGVVTKVLILRAGESHTLFHKQSGGWSNARGTIEIVARKVGVDGRSRVMTTMEWNSGR